MLINGHLRLQNRISQRNHRMCRVQLYSYVKLTKICQGARIREAGDSGKGDSKPESSSAEKSQSETEGGAQRPIEGFSERNPTGPAPALAPDPPAVALPPVPTTDNMIMAEDLIQSDPSWHEIDSLLSLPCTPLDSSSNMTQSLSPTSCTCSPTTGPCPNHVEMLRAQTMADSTVQAPLLLPLCAQYPSRYNHVSLPFGSASSSSSEYGQFAFHKDTSPKLVAHARSSAGPCAPGTHSSESETQIRTVMDAVRRAGFQDFEQMVVVYYTSQFERGSVCAMQQSVSRSRHLKSMLDRLQQSSSQWPRWESRGLHEAISGAAASVCSNELNSVSQAPVGKPRRSETSKLISELEWLLSDHGCSPQTYQSPSIQSKLSEQVEAAPDLVRQDLYIMIERMNNTAVRCHTSGPYLRNWLGRAVYILTGSSALCCL